MKAIPNRTHLSILCSSSLALLAAACNSSSGSSSTPTSAALESEPNDTSALADTIAVGRFATGDVTFPGDVDFWQVNLTQGMTIQIELFAARMQQALWDASGNVPRLTLYDTDGVTKMFEHDYSGNFSSGWSWGTHDLDMPMIFVPATGTYFASVTQDDTTEIGGPYAIRVANLNLGTLQMEAEGVGVSGVNDTSAGAQAITPGTLYGFHVDDEDDFFSFDITGATIVEFELHAYRNGVYEAAADYYDPQISLWDTDGVTSITTNDDAFFYDSGINYELATPGTYFLSVYENDGPDCPYFLTFNMRDASTPTVETEPNDTTGTASAIAYGDFAMGDIDTGEVDFFSFAGVAGDVVRLHVYDDSASQTADDFVVMQMFATDGVTALPISDAGSGPMRIVRTILPETGTFFIEVDPDASPMATSYLMWVERVQTAGFETEGNDVIAMADVMDANGAAAGMMDAANDIDMFSFSATAGQVITFSTLASSSPTSSDGFFFYSGHGSSFDPEMRILSAGGQPMAMSTSNPSSVFTEGVTRGLPTTTLTFHAPAAGMYFLEMTETGGSFGADYFYVIQRN